MTISDAQLAMDRWFAHYKATERRVARELSVPLAALKFVTGPSSDGTKVTSSAFGRRVRAPTGHRAAVKAGLADEGYSASVGPIGWWNCNLTTAGLKAYDTWQIARASIPDRTDPCWLVAP